jgi:hypothetical protein
VIQLIRFAKVKGKESFGQWTRIDQEIFGRELGSNLMNVASGLRTLKREITGCNINDRIVEPLILLDSMGMTR